MVPDFSGYATKAGLKCSDGRTIMPDAFKHQDKLTVPLVYQHDHTNPTNVLGHVELQNRPDGVWVDAYFNDTEAGQHMKKAVIHKDIKMMSIWANKLIERGGQVLSGAIKEVSLVLAGANPGALIDPISIRHSDDHSTVLVDEAIIYTGLEFEIAHADNSSKGDTDMPAEDLTVQDVYDAMDQAQKDVVAFMIATAIEDAATSSLAQSAIDADALKTVIQDTLNHSLNEIKEGLEMSHNAFDQTSGTTAPTISHDDLKAILADAKKGGSFAEAIEKYAVVHNITNIDLLFPDAKNVLDTPEIYKRRTEWVNSFLQGTRKTPFNRIKTLTADLTYDQARAKGYVKATFKKEEFISIGKRTTDPTTVYKKQKLDRDDMVDIQDLDVVAWLKAEMRVMLDEEIARAALLGDGREADDPDKISEVNIRPIAKDSELFTTTVNVNIDDGGSSIQEFLDAAIDTRKFYRGTGLPNFYTTETYIARFLTLKDSTGRKIYNDLAQLQAELRVAAIIGVEPMEEDPTMIGIMVNPIDYVMGATAGGAVSMFENFDIDYNQMKYLIETRMCGALVKLKSAVVYRKVASSVTLVTPTKPTFVVSTGVVTIPTVTGVVYKTATYNSATGAVTDGSTLTAGAQSAIASGATTYVHAVPTNSSYEFNVSSEDFWHFTRS